MRSNEKQDRNIVVEWPVLKRAFLAAVEDGTELESHQPINEKIRTWFERPTMEDSFEGGSAAQTAKHLRQGFRSEKFSHSADYAILSDKKHFTYNEEDGELDLDRVFDGQDAIFMDRELRESRPGLRIMMEFAFVHYTDATTIALYGAWCAALIKSIEATGYDLVIDLWINLGWLFKGDNGRNSNVLIRVKNENENSNFTDWSALFAPTGYRQLGFLAKCVAGEQIGEQVTHYFGHTKAEKDWDVTYDKENLLVMVNVNQRCGKGVNPIDQLNAAAVKAGIIPQAMNIV